jgi:hypothetical protein
MPSLGGAVEWLNSQPLTAAGLRRKVVLIDFWTYTCTTGYASFQRKVSINETRRYLDCVSFGHRGDH